MSKSNEAHLVMKVLTSFDVTIIDRDSGEETTLNVPLKTKNIYGLLPVFKNFKDAQEASENGKYEILTSKVG